MVLKSHYPFLAWALYVFYSTIIFLAPEAWAKKCASSSKEALKINFVMQFLKGVDSVEKGLDPICWEGEQTKDTVSGNYYLVKDDPTTPKNDVISSQFAKCKTSEVDEVCYTNFDALLKLLQPVSMTDYHKNPYKGCIIRTTGAGEKRQIQSANCELQCVGLSGTEHEKCALNLRPKDTEKGIYFINRGSRTANSSFTPWILGAALKSLDKYTSLKALISPTNSEDQVKEVMGSDLNSVQGTAHQTEANVLSAIFSKMWFKGQDVDWKKVMDWQNHAAISKLKECVKAPNTAQMKTCISTIEKLEDSGKYFVSAQQSALAHTFYNRFMYNWLSFMIVSIRTLTEPLEDFAKTKCPEGQVPTYLQVKDTDIKYFCSGKSTGEKIKANSELKPSFDFLKNFHNQILKDVTLAELQKIGIEFLSKIDEQSDAVKKNCMNVVSTDAALKTKAIEDLRKDIASLKLANPPSPEDYCKNFKSAELPPSDGTPSKNMPGNPFDLCKQYKSGTINCSIDIDTIKKFAASTNVMNRSKYGPLASSCVSAKTAVDALNDLCKKEGCDGTGADEAAAKTKCNTTLNSQLSNMQTALGHCDGPCTTTGNQLVDYSTMATGTSTSPLSFMANSLKEFTDKQLELDKKRADAELERIKRENEAEEKARQARLGGMDKTMAGLDRQISSLSQSNNGGGDYGGGGFGGGYGGGGYGGGGGGKTLESITNPRGYGKVNGNPFFPNFSASSLSGGSGHGSDAYTWQPYYGMDTSSMSSSGGGGGGGGGYGGGSSLSLPDGGSSSDNYNNYNNSDGYQSSFLGGGGGFGSMGAGGASSDTASSSSSSSGDPMASAGGDYSGSGDSHNGMSEPGVTGSVGEFFAQISSAYQSYLPRLNALEQSGGYDANISEPD